jgi:hypothetical protein
MLAKDQIRAIARELDRTADERIRGADDHLERQQLWEVVRRACRAIEAVAEMENDEAPTEARTRKARYVVSELETALEAARRAKTAIEWSVPRYEDDVRL